MPLPDHRRFWRSLPWLAACLALCGASVAFAQQEADPPGRVAYASHQEGSVVFAPDGEDEWTELPRNRPLTRGDRLWTDRGARAELQLGTATLQIDGESHLGLNALDEQSAQFILQQGSVSVRVRELAAGENVEIDTPNLALRALQPGTYRVDVDPRSSQTRVSVHSGTAAVFGAGGESLQLGAGQQAGFAGRALVQVQGGTFRPDAFDQWAAQRNQLEDQSIAARYVPRGVVGYSQLDAYGSWGQDPGYGAVWYPRVTAADWAPYRDGRWEWIEPWGWTWIDAAPWGFAPFHYGRWTMIGSRWAWVPGPLEARPLYAPALVVFLGSGGSGFSLDVGAGPTAGWYPLAPGEAWWPIYRATPRYLRHANRHIDLDAYPRNFRNHVWRQRPGAVTTARDDDFRRGRRERNRDGDRVGMRDGVRDGARVRDRDRDGDRDRVRDRGGNRDGDRARDRDGERRSAPRLQAAPPAAQPLDSRTWGHRELAPAVREQRRAERGQEQLQREAERAARQQQREAGQARRQDDLRSQREQLLRQQREQSAPLVRTPERRWSEDDGRTRGEGRGNGRWQRDGDGARGQGQGRWQGDADSGVRGQGRWQSDDGDRGRGAPLRRE